MSAVAIDSRVAELGDLNLFLFALVSAPTLYVQEVLRCEGAGSLAASVSTCRCIGGPGCWQRQTESMIVSNVGGIPYKGL